MKDPMRCPMCGATGWWRSGVHFEHERKCTADVTHPAWDPDDIVEQNRKEQAAGGEE